MDRRAIDQLLSRDYEVGNRVVKLTCAMAIPNPRIRRPIMKRATWKPMQIKATPTIMMLQPMTTPVRRPRISAVYGTMGDAVVDVLELFGNYVHL